MRRPAHRSCFSLAAESAHRSIAAVEVFSLLLFTAGAAKSKWLLLLPTALFCSSTSVVLVFTTTHDYFPRRTDSLSLHSGYNVQYNQGIAVVPMRQPPRLGRAGAPSPIASPTRCRIRIKFSLPLLSTTPTLYILHSTFTFTF